MNADTGLPDDDFDVAFDAASGDESVIEGAEEAQGEVAEIEEVTSEAEGEETAKKKDEEEVEVVSEEDDDLSKPPESSEKKPEPEPETPKADPEAERLAAEEAKKAEDDAKAEAERQATEAAAREQLTDEENETLEIAKTDYPEVIKSMDAYKRVLHAQFENKLQDTIKNLEQRFEQQLAPVASVAQQYARNSHEQAILAKHNDAFTIIPKVEEWVTSQPKFLQDTYNKILDNGTTEQVIDLLDTYKNVSSTAAPNAGKSAEEKAAEETKKKEKEQKLAAQEGVRGRTSTQRATVDPDDFDGAFDKYAEKA